MIRLLGISGRIGAGKDTLAESIRALLPSLSPGTKFIRVGFADVIKEIIIYGFNVPREIAYGTQEQKLSPLPVNPTVSVRQAAQMIGTVFAEIEPMHWVRRALETVDIYTRDMTDAIVVIPDVRFPKEVDAIHGRGGLVVRLLRSTDETDTHVSELALERFIGYDLVIDNRELSANQTAAAVLSWLQKEGWFNASAS